MKATRLLLLAALVIAATLTSGCQWARWLRLLSLKKQLAQVERYVRIDDKGGLKLQFLKPVVYAEDLALLIADETARITNHDRVEWLWSYERQGVSPASTRSNCDLSFTIGFEKNKFSELRFDERFLGIMPKALIVGLLRSVGQAEVNIKRGTVAMKWAGAGPNQKVELPTKTQITKLLGAPFLVSETEGKESYLYKYYQKVPKPSPPCERLAWARFTFSGQGEEILSSQGVIGNVGWRMTRIEGQTEPRVTFSLEPLSVEPVAIRLPSELAEDFVGHYREPDGTVLNFGRDRDIFVVSWTNGSSGGWCAALPEDTNAFFGVPSGLPRGTFLRDGSGCVTGLVAQFQKPATHFAKFGVRSSANLAVAKVDSAVYASCAGRYKASWGGFVTISREGEQLFWQNDGVQTRLPLYPSSETNFFFRAVDSPLTFIRDGSGEVSKFILHYNGHASEAVKMNKPAPSE